MSSAQTNMIKSFKAVAQKCVAFVKENAGAAVKAAAVALGLGALAVPAQSFAVATYDFTGVTSAFTSLSSDTVAATGAVITAGLGVGAVIWGGRLLWRFFKSMAR